MPEVPKIRVFSKNGIRHIVFNRPERRNAVDGEAMGLLLEAMLAAAADESKVIVLTGAGDAFCAGADLAARTPEKVKDYDVTESLRKLTNRTIQTMRRMSKPIIARIHGAAAGVGCNYALACDIRLASDQAKLVQAFIKIGLMPDGGGTYFLPRLVGYAKAFELMATGDSVGAEEALRLGLVNRVLPVPELDSAVEALAGRLAAAPSLALSKIKAALNQGEETALDAALEFEAVHQHDCFRSEDFREGVEAFLQKRAPRFKGR